MNQPFSTAESLRFGWTKTRTNSGLVFKVVLLFAAIVLLQGIAKALISNQILYAVATVVISLVEVVLGVGATVISLKLSRNEKTVLRDVIPPWHITVRCVLASLISGIYTALGALIPIGLGALLVVYNPSPGIFGLVCVYLLVALGVFLGVNLILRYAMVKIAAVDGDISIFGSVRKSARLVRGVKWHLLWFLLIIILLNVAGAMLFFVGLLITAPVTLIAFAHVYLALSEHTDMQSGNTSGL